MKIRALLVVLLFPALAFAEEKPAAPTPPATPAPPAAPGAPVAAALAPDDLVKLKEAVGKPVVVEGTIAAQGENNTATVRYLNFSKNYKESISLVFMVAKGGDQFTTERLSAFVGKKVRVGGTVGIYNDALQIKIEKLDQIQIQP